MIILSTSGRFTLLSPQVTSPSEIAYAGTAANSLVVSATSNSFDENALLVTLDAAVASGANAILVKRGTTDLFEVRC